MTENGISEINEKVKKESSFIHGLIMEMEKVIVGQRYLLERLLVSLLANGHILIEGVPGLAKTTAVKTLSSAIQAKFQRIQFTPDMLPADLTGTLIYDQKTGNFMTKKGPIFSNIEGLKSIERFESAKPTASMILLTAVTNTAPLKPR